MSKRNQYQKEDNLPDTPEMMLANWEAQNANLDVVVQQTAEQYNRADDLFQWLEANAPTPDHQQAAIEAHNITYGLAVRITEMDANRIASANFMKTMFGYHQEIAKEHDDLVSDMQNLNRQNPLVDTLMDDVEQGVMDDMYDTQYDDWAEAYSEAYEAVFDEMHDGMKDITGDNDWAAIHRLSALLTGNGERPPTDEQKQLIAALLNTVRETAYP